MNDDKLFDGVGMVIDDHVYDSEENSDCIIKLVDYLENERKIPLIKYDSLPDFPDINVMASIKFLLLDWDLTEVKDDEGLGLGYIGNIKEDSINKSIEFLCKIVNSLVLPIFIFSNETPNEIQNRLRENNLWNDENSSNSNIFIKSKSDLFDDKDNYKCTMFEAINSWLQKTPSMYVVQKWNNVYTRAINSMALDMQSASAYWPNILWKCYTEDGVNPSDEIASVISQNVLSRIQPIKFDETILGREQTCTSESLKDVLNRQCFIENGKLSGNPSVGDIFKKGGKYYLNIRPACDCVNRGGDDCVKIYLLRGEKIKESNVKDKYLYKYGKFDEQSNTSVVGPIDGSFIEFKFKDLKIEDYSDYKDKRIGRMLPPYITYIAQKFGLYIHRQGLPRLPKEIIPNTQDEVEQSDANQELMENLQQQLDECNRRNKELTKKIKMLEKRENIKSQPIYRLINCKVSIIPSLKKRRFKK